MKTIRPAARRTTPLDTVPFAPVSAETPPPTLFDDELPESVKVVPTIFPTSAPLEDSLEAFWETGPEFPEIRITIAPPQSPLGVLEALGPSPFPRGGFPMVGFLATTYDKVSRYALDRKE